MEQRIYIGTELKFNIHIEPVSGEVNMVDLDLPLPSGQETEEISDDPSRVSLITHMKALNFKAIFYTIQSDRVVLEKSEKSNDLIEVDQDNYLAIIDTSDMRPGKLKLRLEILIPDDDCVNVGNDGFRQEVIVKDCEVLLIN